MSGDDARIAYPLFQAEDGGPKPTSPLQMRVYRISQFKAIILNKIWHRTQPEIPNYWYTNCYGAFYQGIIYAVAIWSLPIAKKLNFQGIYELRRFAIAPDAPRNTASWMLAVMSKLIKESKPDIVTIISYQDTSMHDGTIYRAAGWTPIPQKEGHGKGWGKGWHSRLRKGSDVLGDKIRWQKELRIETSPEPPETRKRSEG